jgi:hypothetical protein
MHHLNRTVLASVAMLTLGLCTLNATAADETKTAKPASTAIDGSKLGQMLDDMGYETKKINDTTYDVILKRDNWTIYLRTMFSADGTKLWLHSNLATIDDMSKVPTEVLIKLMEANGVHGPSFFYLSTDTRSSGTKYLQIVRPLDNRSITAKTLRTEIDTICTTIKNTQSLWKPEEWRKLQATTPAANGNSVRQDTKVSQ